MRNEMCGRGRLRHRGSITVLPATFAICSKGAAQCCSAMVSHCSRQGSHENPTPVPSFSLAGPGILGRVTPQRQVTQLTPRLPRACTSSWLSICRPSGPTGGSPAWNCGICCTGRTRGWEARGEQGLCLLACVTAASSRSARGPPHIRCLLRGLWCCSEVRTGGALSCIASRSSAGVGFES